MKSEFKSIFCVPLGIYRFNEDEDIPKLFSELTNQIYNSENINDYENIAKRENVTTDYDAFQIKIKTGEQDPSFMWDNDWWAKGNAMKLLGGLLEILQIFKSDTETNLWITKAESGRTFVKDFWMLTLKENQNNIIHVHPGSTFSGIYYQSVPNSTKKSLNNNEGCLVLMDSTHKQMFSESYGAAQTFIIRPHPGLMVIFPSWLSHYVIPFKEPGERISYAFNIIDET